MNAQKHVFYLIFNFISFCKLFNNSQKFKLSPKLNQIQAKFQIQKFGVLYHASQLYICIHK